MAHDISRTLGSAEATPIPVPYSDPYWNPLGLNSTALPQSKVGHFPLFFLTIFSSPFPSLVRRPPLVTLSLLLEINTLLQLHFWTCKLSTELTRTSLMLSVLTILLTVDVSRLVLETIFLTILSLPVSLLVSILHSDLLLLCSLVTLFLVYSLLPLVSLPFS
jgi:hypothetical protein